jgi:hypothetical protein
MTDTYDNLIPRPGHPQQISAGNPPVEPVQYLPPAPQVLFPGDIVPEGMRVMNRIGEILTWPKDYPLREMTVVEIHAPTDEEWQATVDRAKAARAHTRCCIGPFADGRHAANCSQACQDCGGDETGPCRCRCRDAAPQSREEGIAAGHRVPDYVIPVLEADDAVNFPDGAKGHDRPIVSEEQYVPCKVDDDECVGQVTADALCDVHRRARATTEETQP